MIQVIDSIIRTTHHAYGYRHLGEIGQQLRERYAGLEWAKYGCKNLLGFLQKYPDTFRIKWSAPAHKGRSAVWVRLAKEPKLKEGYK